LLFLAVFSQVIFENAVRNIYVRIVGRRIFCIQALLADPEISLEPLSDRKTNFILRIHNYLRVLAGNWRESAVVRKDSSAHY
jgi:hypothetical protein